MFDVLFITFFVLLYIYPMIKDVRGGYQSQYDTISDRYIDLELTKRYIRKK